MVLHNTPEKTSPIFQPESDRIVGAPIDAHTADGNGMFHRFSLERSRIVQDEMRRFAADSAISPSMPLNLYQTWVECSWKEPPGTIAATQRFSSKLLEELGEFNDDLQDCMQNPQKTTVTAATGELGDVLWCATALAVNGGANIDTAIKLRMYEYSVGIRVHATDDQATPPDWQPASAALATKYDHATIDDIQNVIDAGFPSFASAVMTLQDHAEAVEVPDWQTLYNDILTRSISLKNYCQQPYDSENSESIMTHGEFARRGREIINPLIADIYLLSAVIASRILHTSLAEVIIRNVRKIDNRIQANHIDKSDGERSIDEQ